MAFLWADSCGDHYNAANLLKKWTTDEGLTKSLTTGRNGNGITGTGGLRINLSADCATIIIGWAMKLDALPSTTQRVLRIYDFTGVGLAGGYQIKVEVDSTGKVNVYRGTGLVDAAAILLGSSAGGVVRGATFQFYEVKIGFATGATGTVNVHVDEVTVLTVTNVQTAQSANAFASIVAFEVNPSAPNIIIDDVYVCDATGAVHNDFLGDNAVLVLLPTADGRIDQWNFTGAANAYQCVNENPPDGDTSYVYEITVNDVEVFAMADLPATVSSVTAVQNILCARKDAPGGSRTIASAIGDGASEVISANNIRPGDDYVFFTEPYDQDPVSAAAWTPAKVNSMQAGGKLIA